MPVKGKPVKRNRKRKGRRPVRKQSMFSVGRPMGSGIPSSVFMKMKYSDIYVPTTTTSPFSHFFNLNGMYDVDQTGIGHQPFYFDQLTQLYSRYTVYGCKAVITASCATGLSVVGLRPQRDTVGLPNAVQIAERPAQAHMLLSSSAGSKTIARYFDISKLFGVTRSAINDETSYSGTNGANPTSLQYLQVITQHPDSATTQTTAVEITLTYYVKWHDRFRQAQS